MNFYCNSLKIKYSSNNKQSLESYYCPQIFADILIQFFLAVRNYKSQLGVTITDVKTKS